MAAAASHAAPAAPASSSPWRRRGRVPCTNAQTSSVAGAVRWLTPCMWGRRALPVSSLGFWQKRRAHLRGFDAPHDGRHAAATAQFHRCRPCFCCASKGASGCCRRCPAGLDRRCCRSAPCGSAREGAAGVEPLPGDAFGASVMLVGAERLTTRIAEGRAWQKEIQSQARAVGARSARRMQQRWSTESSEDV